MWLLPKVQRMEVQEFKGTRNGEARRCRLLMTTVTHLDVVGIVVGGTMQVFRQGKVRQEHWLTVFMENMLTTLRKNW